AGGAGRHLRTHVHVAGRAVSRARGGRGVTARWRRLAGVLLSTRFRAVSRIALACLVLGIGAAVASVTYSIGFRVLIDGAIAHAGSRVALGPALTASLFTASGLVLSRG